jgi:hypothetical protein
MMQPQAHRLTICIPVTGEVVIPLQEAASFGDMRSEVKRYTLGRRTTKEKVSGKEDVNANARLTLMNRRMSCTVMMSGRLLNSSSLDAHALTLKCQQVSGDIALGCRWRVSPLDVLALQVRGRQEELDYKQELVAIIKDWCVVFLFSCGHCCNTGPALQLSR